jgi:hypothetical protein
MLARLEQSLAEAKSNLAGTTVSNHRAMIGNLRKNDSVKAFYDTMLNQCVVLLVRISDQPSTTLFAMAFSSARTRAGYPIAKQEIKVRMGDLWQSLDDERRADNIADMAIDQQGSAFRT